MKKLVLAIAMMTVFAANTPAATDHMTIPIPEDEDYSLPPAPTPPVPECWPVCG